MSKLDKKKSDYSTIPCSVKNALKPYVLCDEALRIIKSLFENELYKGLAKKTHASSIVKCFVTYVQDLPSGDETGKFLALDLGGTNFRVLMITLPKQGQEEIVQKIYELPKDKIVGAGKDLFDHVASCLADFCTEYKVTSEKLPLGFTFSFPVIQKGLTKGILERWTKGFNCPDVVGKDVSEMLVQSINARSDVKIDVIAIINDTTGTLLSCAWKDHDTYVGLIVGTGCNACYVEKVKRAEMFEGTTEKPYVIINTEWGAFGDDGIIDLFRTDHDKTIDKNSINPGKQLFEKMISGMYMGELVRLILMELAEQGIWMVKAQNNLGKLKEKGSFETRHVSEAEADDGNCGMTACKKVLDDLGVDTKQATKEDLLTLRYVCETVSCRAADLCSIGICSLLQKMGRKTVTIGVDGSVYKKHPYFAKRMQETIDRLSPHFCKATCKLSEDGSGLGAALVAAVASMETHGKIENSLSTISVPTVSAKK